MEYIYAELIRNDKRELGKIPSGKIPATAVLLIIGGDKTIDDVPEAYREKTISLLEEQGYDGYGGYL